MRTPIVIIVLGPRAIFTNKMFDEIKKSIEQAAGKEPGLVIYESERSDFGDYSTNAAFILSKKLKKSKLNMKQRHLN